MTLRSTSKLPLGPRKLPSGVMLLAALVSLFAPLCSLSIMMAWGGLVQLPVSVLRPRITERSGRFFGFVNSPSEFISTARFSLISACLPSFSNNRNISYNWTISSGSNRSAPPEEIVTVRCQLRWQAPREGVYSLLVVAWHSARPERRLAVGTRNNIVIKDLWIVALGDSFASGQGNPDSDVQMMGIVPPTWIDAECFRSSKSWTFQTYKLLADSYPDHGVLFTYLACSGASIASGLLGRGPMNLNLPPQIDTLALIQEKSNKFFQTNSARNQEKLRPDVVLLSVGGNDIGYSEILFSILWGDAEAMLNQIPHRLRRLRPQLQRLAEAFSERLSLPSSAIFYTHYFDISRNERGDVDASCPGFYAASTEDLERSDEEILRKLNREISAAAERHNWTAVEEIAEIFSTHGFCSADSFILSIEDSVRRQGNWFGGFHPDQRAHLKIAKRVWTQVRDYLALRSQ